MVGFAVSIVVFVLLAALVLRWARADLRDNGGPTTRSAVAAWLLYVLHADSVAWAAWGQMALVGIPEGPALAVGIVVGGMGFLLFLVSSVQLGTRADFSQMRPSRLVTSGVYRWGRHPQNTGWALVLTGTAIGGRSLLALALVLLFVAFADRFVRIEDQQLAEAFGPEYERYRDATPAVPWVGSSSEHQPA